MSKYVKDNIKEEGIFLVSYSSNSNYSSLNDYVDCYDMTIEALLKPIRERGRSEAIEDMYTYPILFMLRHVVELSMKRFIYYLNARYKNKQKIADGHDLESLRDQVMHFFSEVEELKCFKEELKKRNKVLKFFIDNDPFNDVFRYSHLKNNKEMGELKFNFFREKQKYIYIDELKIDVDRLLHFFSFIEDSIDELSGSIIT